MFKRSVISETNNTRCVYIVYTQLDDTPAAEADVISIRLASSSGLWCSFPELQHLLNVQLHIHYGYVAIFKTRQGIMLTSNVYIVQYWVYVMTNSGKRHRPLFWVLILHLLLASLASHFPLGQLTVRMMLMTSPLLTGRSCLRSLLATRTLAWYMGSSSPVIWDNTWQTHQDWRTARTHLRLCDGH